MVAGRPGTSKTLKLLAGGNQHRVNRDEPIAEEGIPTCPSTNEQVREVWDYTIRQLELMKVLTLVDRDLLHAYCEQVVIYREAAKLVHEDGVIVQSARGPVKHPAAVVMREAGTLMKDFARHFGLTPQGRAGITVADQTVAKTSAGPSRLLSG